MFSSNFIPAGPHRRLKQVHYTDGSPSREIEEVNEMPMTTELRILTVEIRERLLRITELIKEMEQELAKL